MAETFFGYVPPSVHDSVPEEGDFYVWVCGSQRVHYRKHDDRWYNFVPNKNTFDAHDGLWRFENDDRWVLVDNTQATQRPDTGPIPDHYGSF